MNIIGTMRTLILGMLFCLVSGDDEVSYATGSVGRDVLLPCNCPDRDLDKEFKWQAEIKGNITVLVVKHTGNTSNFTDDYKDRAELFLSKNWKSSNCSLLLKNIRPEDEGKYKCSFKNGGQHNYSFVNLTVSTVGNPAPLGGRTGTHLVPTEPPSPDNLQILWLLLPVALVVVSLFLFFLYKRRASRKLNADEEESAEKLNV